jgi:hypothetical protein
MTCWPIKRREKSAASTPMANAASTTGNSRLPAGKANRRDMVALVNARSSRD